MFSIFYGIVSCNQKHTSLFTRKVYILESKVLILISIVDSELSPLVTWHELVPTAEASSAIL